MVNQSSIMHKKVCLNCKKSYERGDKQSNWHFNKSKYCSKKCGKQKRARDGYQNNPKLREYRKEYMKDMLGKMSPEEKKAYHKKIRSSPRVIKTTKEYYQKNKEKMIKKTLDNRLNERKVIFDKYSNQCAICSFAVKDALDIHHLRPSEKRHKNDLKDKSNLILLCPNCHRLVHLGKLII